MVRLNSSLVSRLKDKLSRLEITQKLNLAILGICSFVLVFTAGAFLSIHYLILEQQFSHSTTNLAQSVAGHSLHAIATRDEEEALEALSSLRETPEILFACIAFSDGSILASFGDSRFWNNDYTASESGRHQIDDNLLLLPFPIGDNETNLGVLYLIADYKSSLLKQINKYAILLAGIIGAAILIGTFLSTRFTRVITRPILKLAQTAQEVATRHDYSIRAEKSTEDEIGHCAEGFNQMLSRIQRRDHELRVAREELHEQVERLKNEAAERLRAQKESELLEEQLRHAHKMEAIGTLAGGIAHDFNNVLMAVIGNAEFALEDVPKGSPIYHKLKDILTASEQATHIIKQILAFSRKHEDPKEIVDIQGLMKDSLELLQRNLPSSIDLLPKFAAKNGVAMADASQIQQILMNLCDNAKAAIGGKPGTIELSLEDFEADEAFAKARPPLQAGPHLRITLKDNGRGIAPEIITRIFEPFYSTEELNTGMGLAVVHSIVESHKGYIEVASSNGNGALFSIYLRQADPQELPTPASAKRDSRPSPESTTGERILIVDDEKMILKVLSSSLEKLGYKVVGFDDPQQALKEYQSDPEAFDLVVTDQTMPKITGDLLSRKILRTRPDQAIILCSGFSESIDEERAEAMGIRLFLRKPIKARALGSAIRSILDEQN